MPEHLQLQADDILTNSANRVLGLVCEAGCDGFLDEAVVELRGRGRVVQRLGRVEANRGGRIRPQRMGDVVLYYRMVGAKLVIPPLRERKEDLVEIAGSIVERLAQKYGRPFELPLGTVEALLRHDWPGNVRELEQALGRGALLSASPAIDVSSLQLPAQATTRRSAMEAADRAQIERALAVTKGNKKLAAETLGISRVTLYRWLRRYEMA